MEFLSYIETDGQCYFDTGIIPTLNTKIVATITPLAGTPTFGVFIGSSSNDGSKDTFFIRKYGSSSKWSFRVGNVNVESGDIRLNYTNGTDYAVQLDKDVFKANSTTWNIGAGEFTTSLYSLYIGGWHRGDKGGFDTGRGSVARFSAINIYENGVQIANFIPVNNNGQLGFLETFSGSFKGNLGTGTPVAGQSLGSIVMITDKDFLPASGGTATFKVYTDNAWSVATAENWFTLSATGGTGNGTFTLTAPSYTGLTARTDVITATDTITSDYAFIPITQKKYTSGQPLYLGADEITELYIGTHQISEAYLGTDLVYSSTAAGLKARPSKLTFNSFSPYSAVKIKSSEQWAMSLPNWIIADTLTGDTGETIVSLTATTQQAETSSTITITSANYSANITAFFYLPQQLKCIYSAGTVEMGFSTSEDLVWTFNGQILSPDGGVLLGIDNAPDNNDYRYFKTTAAKDFFDIGNSRIEGNWNIALNTDVELIGGNYYLKVDGTTKGSGVYKSVVPTGVFCVNTDKVKMYSLVAEKVSDATLLIANIIPIKVGSELYFLNQKNGAIIPINDPNAQYETL